MLPDCLQVKIATSTLPWVSRLLAKSADFGLANLHDHRSQFLRIHLPLSIAKSNSKFYINLYIRRGRMGRSDWDEIRLVVKWSESG